jgi:tRNA(Ile)-lysidine synthase
MSKSGFNSIQQQVSTQVNHLFPNSPLFVVGVSGGADSMALLYILKKIGVQVFVVHINYALRGQESESDQELVEGMAAVWGYDCCSVRLDSTAIDGNFQKWAREERYRIFRDFKVQLQAHAIVTAHHLDDQLETILQRILRGGNPATWAGMKQWDGELFRPLLDIPKQEVLEFCSQQSVPFHDDTSNFESKYARNFLRNNVFPGFDNLFPGWKQNLRNLEYYARQNSKAIHFITERCLGEEGLIIREFNSLTGPLKAAVLKQFIETKTGEILSKSEISNLVSIGEFQVGKMIPLNNQWQLLRDREYLKLIRETGKVSGGHIITQQDVEHGMEVSGLRFGKQGSQIKLAALNLDFDQLNWPLTLRRWKNGDSFQPLGMDGSQKISDHLTNRKVSASKKKESLILSGADGTIYALFYAAPEPGTISERAKVTQNTRHTLTITR